MPPVCLVHKNGLSAWRRVHRSRGSGCPVCDGKIAVPGDNDLLTLFPDIAAEWDTERNGNLTPNRVTPYSNRKAWWRCSRGHAWEAVTAPRVVKMPVVLAVSGRLFALVLMTGNASTSCAQWDPARNGDLMPEMFTIGSHKRIWWKCSAGHVWKAAYPRTGKRSRRRFPSAPR